jgi:hypothetical protein
MMRKTKKQQKEQEDDERDNERDKDDCSDSYECYSPTAGVGFCHIHIDGMIS